MPGNLIHLNRTPPLYSNEAQDDGQRPSASVRVLRMPDNTGIIFLQWEDESENHFGTGKKYPDGEMSTFIKLRRCPQIVLGMLPV